MSIEMLDINLLTEEEFISGLKRNSKEATRMKKEIEKLELAQLEQIASEITTPKVREKTEEEQIVDMIVHDEGENDFQDTVDFYYQDLVKIDDSSDIYNDIKEVLPSKKNYDYSKILVELKLRLCKEIKDTNELLHSEKMNIEKTDLVMFRDDIELNKRKIEIISKIQNEKEIENSKIEKENNLIFTFTSGGNVRALDEIDHIDSAYYEKFKGLFDSIKDGTFKNVKRFVKSNNLNAGVCQVKDHKVRVVFDRLSKTDYVIIAVFTKKNDNDKGYRSQVISKINDYRLQRDRLKKGLTDSCSALFRQENKHYEEELYNKLNNQNTGNKILVKGGDSCE